MRISKIMVALLVSVVALTAMMGVAVAEDEELESCDVDGNPTWTFYAGDRIYVTDKPLSVTLDEHAPNGKVWMVANRDWGPSRDGDNLSKYSYHEDNAAGTFPDVFVSGVGVNSSGKFNGTPTTNGIVDICAVNELSGIYPNYYDIVYDADGDGYYNCTCNAPLGCYDFSCCTDLDCPDKVDKLGCQGVKTDIPEFATIAIPVIAVLGLFLFFNKRKHKKD